LFLLFFNIESSADNQQWQFQRHKAGKVRKLKETLKENTVSNGKTDGKTDRKSDRKSDDNSDIQETKTEDSETKTETDIILTEDLLLENKIAPFITTGLFSYSRHPNFFAEQAIWVCFYLFTIDFRALTNTLENVFVILFGTVFSMVRGGGNTDTDAESPNLRDSDANSSTRTAGSNPNIGDPLDFSVTLTLLGDILFNWSIIGCVALILLFDSSTTLTEWISCRRYPKTYPIYQQSVQRLMPIGGLCQKRGLREALVGDAPGVSTPEVLVPLTSSIL
jgi:hypothetical protein